MSSAEIYWFSVVVSLATWLTPMPTHAEGKLVAYGNQRLVEANAEYRGYDLSPYYQRCGVAALSPADLGEIVWLRAPGLDWYGPCLVVDVAARQHFARAVWYVEEVVEVSDEVRYQFGFTHGRWGEVYVGRCPPPDNSRPTPYDPPLVVDLETQGQSYAMYPYPPQVWPVECRDKSPLRGR